MWTISLDCMKLLADSASLQTDGRVMQPVVTEPSNSGRFREPTLAAAFPFLLLLIPQALMIFHIPYSFAETFLFVCETQMEEHCKIPLNLSNSEYFKYLPFLRFITVFVPFRTLFCKVMWGSDLNSEVFLKLSSEFVYRYGVKDCFPCKLSGKELCSSPPWSTGDTFRGSSVQAEATDSAGPCVCGVCSHTYPWWSLTCTSGTIRDWQQ